MYEGVAIGDAWGSINHVAASCGKQLAWEGMSDGTRPHVGMERKKDSEDDRPIPVPTSDLQRPGFAVPDANW